MHVTRTFGRAYELINGNGRARVFCIRDSSLGAREAGLGLAGGGEDDGSHEFINAITRRALGELSRK